MSDEERQWRSWIGRLAKGEETVVREFWEEYGGRMQGLAAAHLASKLYRREGPEDVVQSACRTFLRRARDGQFDLADEDSLWRLLCAITLAKTREKARFHGRQNRAAGREQSIDSSRFGGGVAAGEPTPAEAVEFADQLQHLLAKLDDEERQVVQWRLEEYTYEEIAEKMECSKRTVRRIIQRVQAHWQRAMSYEL